MVSLSLKLRTSLRLGHSHKLRQDHRVTSLSHKLSLSKDSKAKLSRKLRTSLRLSFKLGHRPR
jgi:hypothetical protein